MTKFLLCFMAIAAVYSVGAVNGWMLRGEVRDFTNAIPLVGGFLE